MVQMRAGEKSYAVTLPGQDIAVNERPPVGRAQPLTHTHTATVTGAHARSHTHGAHPAIQRHTSKCADSSSRTTEVFIQIFK